MFWGRPRASFGRAPAAIQAHALVKENCLSEKSEQYRLVAMSLGAGGASSVCPV